MASHAFGQGTTAPPLPEIALFRDATESLFAVADLRRVADPSAPPVPPRHFVKDADEAHSLALGGPIPVVGMSLDDLFDCRRMDHPGARDLVAFSAVHRGFLQLMATSGITTIADLKGKRVAVDTDTGYASALFEILRRHDLLRGRDYEVVYAGATNLRYAKLLDGAFDATLLGAPFTRMAQAKGFRSLGSVIDALGGYQAIVLCARTPWLDANPAAARAMADCLTGTLAFTRTPQGAPAIDAYLAALLPDGPAELRAGIGADLFGPKSEFLADGRPHARDVEVVIELFNASRGTKLTPAEAAAAWRLI
ncbi:ABC transporter substrate-binding protein [Aquabacter cavernae]|uniref:ABC transporter substrate-binding protein n=1 Tax=Aquabacter cavernae TaxID=2496029 RepID=UPI0013E03668|nr:ABC transporter substrate-binding protein [Aquabacter cavernae]